VELREIANKITSTTARAQSVVDAGDSEDPFKHRAFQLATQYLETLGTETPESILAERRELEKRRKTEDEDRERRGRQGKWLAIVSERGKRYANCSLATYDAATEPQRVAVEQIRAWITDLPKKLETGAGLVLIGPAGTGKDHLAAAVMRAAVLHFGIDVKWTNGPDLWESIRDGIKSQDSEWERIKDYAREKLLVISDPALRGQPLTTFQGDVLYRIVDARYNNLRPTVFTANVQDRTELEGLLGGAVVDRITDGALVIRCDWPSYRKPESKP